MTLTRLILPVVILPVVLLAAAGCNRTEPMGTRSGTANPPTRAMPGPDPAGGAQRLEDPGNRPRPMR